MLASLLRKVYGVCRNPLPLRRWFDSVPLLSVRYRPSELRARINPSDSVAQEKAPPATARGASSFLTSRSVFVERIHFSLADPALASLTAESGRVDLVDEVQITHRHMDELVGKLERHERRCGVCGEEGMSLVQH